MPAEPIIEVRDLHVSLNSYPVLRGVNLSVPKGQLVALIGPNGSGKTTLLRCLTGLQRFQKGTVRLFGKEPSRGILSRIGYVPQKLLIEPSFILTVREFLALKLRQTKFWFWKKSSSTDQFLEPILQELGAIDLLDRPIAKLSGGQLQRVLIAFSLLTEPDLLLLDEPTAGVDTPGESSFYELISQIHQRRGLTILLVSHDLSMVYRHAAWVYALNGVICCEGSPEQVMNAESLKEAYGIHVSPYHHHHHEGHPHFHPIEFKKPLSSQKGSGELADETKNVR
jgi:zinc transport system ATP-binding protein